MIQNMSPTEEAAAKAIRRAKPKPFVLITTSGGYRDVLTAKEFKALKPSTPDLYDADVSWAVSITPKFIAKLVSLMDTPPYFEAPDGESFSRKDVEKAKHLLGITFQYEERTAILLSNGLLAIGCQKHPLSVWATTEPDDFGETQLARYLVGNAAARDALIPVLKLKLKELRAA